jgi:hypothetical protein
MALKANLLIDQGSTYSTTLMLTTETDEAMDLSGYTGAAQVRKHYTSSNSSAFSVDLNTNTGTVTLSMSANTTANLVAGRYVYDVEITSGSGNVTRVVEGIVTVTPNVTR